MSYIDEVKNAWKDNKEYSIVEIKETRPFQAEGIIKENRTGKLIACSKIQSCGACANKN